MHYHLTTYPLLLSTHSLDTCLWGGGIRTPTFGPSASLYLHLASSSITLAGSVHKSRGDSVVHMWLQMKRWCVSCVWVLQRGHSGDRCDMSMGARLPLTHHHQNYYTTTTNRFQRQQSTSGGTVRSSDLHIVVISSIQTVSSTVFRIRVSLQQLS